MKNIYFFCTCLFITVTACTNQSDEVVNYVDVGLQQGKTTCYEGFCIKVLEVKSSLCPCNADCFHQGELALTLQITKENVAKEFIYKPATYGKGETMPFGLSPKLITIAPTRCPEEIKPEDYIVYVSF